MDVRDWIEFGIFLLSAVGGLVIVVRYIDTQISGMKLKISDRTLDVDRQLGDKLSIGEYNRRHEDLERRIRSLERWQDHANGRYRHEYGQEED